MTQYTKHPPVPKVLQEALKDYPELIARLEEGLKTVGRSPGMSKEQLADQLEASVGLLESILGLFAAHAADERASAATLGDPVALEKAKSKDVLMFDCRARVPDTLEELAAFFA